MDVHKIYDSILEDWLPTKWSRWIAGLTPSTAIGGIFFPNFLQTIDIHPSPEQTLLIRLSVPPTILFLGTFTVLLLVVRHLKSFKKTNAEDCTVKTNPIDSLSEQAIALLQAIATLENEYKKTAGYQDYYTLSEVAFSRNIEISPQRLRFLLEQLLYADCISRYPSGNFGGLKPEGRKFLHDKGLLP